MLSPCDIVALQLMGYDGAVVMRFVTRNLYRDGRLQYVARILFLLLLQFDTFERFSISRFGKDLCDAQDAGYNRPGDCY